MSSVLFASQLTTVGLSNPKGDRNIYTSKVVLDRNLKASVLSNMLQSFHVYFEFLNFCGIHGFLFYTDLILEIYLSHSLYYNFHSPFAELAP